MDRRPIPDAPNGVAQAVDKVRRAWRDLTERTRTRPVESVYPRSDQAKRLAAQDAVRPIYEKQVSEILARVVEGREPGRNEGEVIKGLTEVLKEYQKATQPNALGGLEQQARFNALVYTLNEAFPNDYVPELHPLRPVLDALHQNNLVQARADAEQQLIVDQFARSTATPTLLSEVAEIKSREVQRYHEKLIRGKPVTSHETLQYNGLKNALLATFADGVVPEDHPLYKVAQELNQVPSGRGTDTSVGEVLPATERDSARATHAEPELTLEERKIVERLKSRMESMCVFMGGRERRFQIVLSQEDKSFLQSSIDVVKAVAERASEGNQTPTDLAQCKLLRVALEDLLVPDKIGKYDVLRPLHREVRLVEASLPIEDIAGVRQEQKKLVTLEQAATERIMKDVIILCADKTYSNLQPELQARIDALAEHSTDLVRKFCAGSLTLEERAEYNAMQFVLKGEREWENFKEVGRSKYHLDPSIYEKFSLAPSIYSPFYSPFPSTANGEAAIEQAATKLITQYRGLTEIDLTPGQKTTLGLLEHTAYPLYYDSVPLGNTPRQVSEYNALRAVVREVFMVDGGRGYGVLRPIFEHLFPDGNLDSEAPRSNGLR